jgi:hypothetical protein
MIQIKSELSKIQGKIEGLDNASSLTTEKLYPLLERAYLLIADYFEIVQCHSIIHNLVQQMKELKDFEEAEEKTSSDEKKMLETVRDASANELRIFISHL